MKHINRHGLKFYSEFNWHNNINNNIKSCNKKIQYRITYDINIKNIPDCFTNVRHYGILCFCVLYSP